MSAKKTHSLPYHRVVIKFGTSLITGGTNHLDLDIMSNLVSQVAHLHRLGLEPVIVSSGAIASGRYRLGLSKKLRDIPLKQVLAAVGQTPLMHNYEQLFGKYDITVAQALLTKSVMVDRAGYLNARNTLLALLDLRIICIVNENDVVAVDEIKAGRFGDNDNLSAMVANLVDADLLIILSDITGLHTADPQRNADAQLIPRVEKIDRKIERLASSPSSNLGTGGMITKIEAARLATNSGVTVIIASGSEKDVIVRLASGEAIGTCFLPASSRLESRKRWMLSGLRTTGRLVIDDGAALALKKQNRSLLAAGIKQKTGNFERGDVLDIFDMEGTQLGCGITNYSSRDVEKIMGVHSTKIATLVELDYGPEVIHRNNLAVL